jgi:hypothetical protein
MSKKTTTNNYPFNKDVILFVSHQGSETKSMLANLTAYACEQNGVELAKYDADGQNKTTFKRYASRDETGMVLHQDMQDAVKGCKAFNFETDSLEIVNALQSDTEKLMIDLPARSIEKMLAMFGDEGIFYSSFSTYERNLILLIPIASDKSFLSVKSMYESVDALELEYPVTFCLVKNAGFMKTRKCLSQVEELYDNDIFVSAMRTNPKFNLIEITVNTMFDEKGYINEALANDKLSDVIAIPQGQKLPTVHILLQNMKKDANEIYKKLIVRE